MGPRAWYGPFGMEVVIWIIFLFALGACVGSFLNVVIYRVPRGESIVFPGSHCPACGRPIKWYDNLPLLSWVVLRGRCRQCKAAISPRYLVVEAATAVRVAGLFVCYYLVAVRAGAGAFTSTWPMFVAHVALLCGLLACSAVDIEHWIVPVEVCWLVSAVGVISAGAAPHPWVPRVSAPVAATGLAGAVGLGIALVLQHYGLIQQSFIDAAEKPDEKAIRQQERKRRKKGKGKGKKKRKGPQAKKQAQDAAPAESPPALEPAAPAPSALTRALRAAFFPLKALFMVTTAFLFGSVLMPQDSARRSSWQWGPGCW
jgi:prepilin signal peptidase PulO-like enzyme (type II secretory pathway)